ncbi:unnamed protein product, partial [Urochloa humidicola]
FFQFSPFCERNLHLDPWRKESQKWTLRTAPKVMAPYVCSMAPYPLAPFVDTLAPAWPRGQKYGAKGYGAVLLTHGARCHGAVQPTL